MMKKGNHKTTLRKARPMRDRFHDSPEFQSLLQGSKIDHQSLYSPGAREAITSSC